MAKRQRCFCRSGRKGYDVQVEAPNESAFSNYRHSAGNGDAGQAFAAHESGRLNYCNTAGKLHAGQIAAAFERTLSNAPNSVGNGDAGQIVAAIESIVSNAGDTRSNCNRLDAGHAACPRHGVIICKVLHIPGAGDVEGEGVAVPAQPCGHVVILGHADLPGVVLGAGGGGHRYGAGSALGSVRIAGGGDDGRTCRNSGDYAVLNRGDACVTARPCDGFVRGVVRCDGGRQRLRAAYGEGCGGRVEVHAGDSDGVAF